MGVVSRRGHYRFEGQRHAPRTACAAVDPVAAWRALVQATRAAVRGELHGPGDGEVVEAPATLLTRLREARLAALGAGGFPPQGEDAKAISNSLLEKARTWPLTTDQRRGWFAAAMVEDAAAVDAFLDQLDFARSAMGRRSTGED